MARISEEFRREKISDLSLDLDEILKYIIILDEEIEALEESAHPSAAKIEVLEARRSTFEDERDELQIKIDDLAAGRDEVYA